MVYRLFGQYRYPKFPLEKGLCKYPRTNAEDLIFWSFNIFSGKKPKYQVAPYPQNNHGSAEGVLVGGNLALVYALLGSSYSVDFRDKILFIEDIGENFYSLDRMLISLDLAGVFRKIKGIIIGGMINMGNETENPDYEYSYDAMAYEIIAERLKKYSFPKLFAFPNGHIFDNVPLILGSEIKLNVSETGAKVEFL